MRIMSSPTALLVCLSLLVLLSNHQYGSVVAFSSILPQQSRALSRRITFNNNNINYHVAPPYSRQSQASSSTSLNMFMGSDGGILGIGTPEIFTILLVGYFVLGPSDLFKLVKEIGKFIQNIRTFSTDLTTTFESNMENQLQLEELRKAQRELNDAFSFRRTINVDDQADAFSTKPASYYETNAGVTGEGGAAAAATAAVAAEPTAAAATTTAEPPKKIRRRVRKKKAPSEVPPELEMPAATSAAASSTTTSTTTSETASNKGESMYTAQELAEIEAEFSQYTQTKEDKSSATFPSSLSSSAEEDTTTTDDDKAAQSRFQQQLSGNWNEQILANQEKIEPLATVMNKIALLEKEKKAAVARLEEEFQKRTELENKYYNEQRELLEQAARQVQDQAVGLD